MHDKQAREKHGAAVLFYRWNQQGQPEVLVQQKDDGFKPCPNGYAIFGGAIEKGEDPRQTIVREMQEEIAINKDDEWIMLKISPESLQELTVFEDWRGSVGDPLRHNHHIFLASCPELEDIDYKKVYVLEGRGAKWMSLDDVRESKFIHAHGSTVEAALIYLKNMQNEQQSGMQMYSA